MIRRTESKIPSEKSQINFLDGGLSLTEAHGQSHPWADMSDESVTARLSSTISSAAGSFASTVKPAENELSRWRRTFDRFAKEDVDGKK